MKNGRARTAVGAVAMICVLLGLTHPAEAEYGVRTFDVQMAANAPQSADVADLAPSGGSYHLAGGHPYAVATHIEWNTHPSIGGLPLPDADIKDAFVKLPPGMVGNPASLPTCTAGQLAGNTLGGFLSDTVTECPIDSQVGLVHLFYTTRSDSRSVVLPVFNMSAPTGVVARFGFNVVATLVYLDASTDQESEYRVTVGSHDAQQALRIYRVGVVLWGVPADPAHDIERCEGDPQVGLEGTAAHAVCTGDLGEPAGPHVSGRQPSAFLRLPTSCPSEGYGEEWSLRTNSWNEPDRISEASVFSHLAPFAPDPTAPGPEQGTTECGRVPFNPNFTTQPSLQSATSPSGLDVDLSFPTDGLLNPKGLSQSDLKDAVVRLPDGVTINPSQADGLGVCTPAQYAEEKVDNAPGEGCPSTAKIGTVEVHTPLLTDTLAGNVYVAEPYDNPFHSLLALYIVIRNHDRGLIVTLPGKVETDPRTGQIVTTFQDLPQVPVESFHLHFREGARAPLVTPQACGTYTTVADFYPWARPTEPVTTESSFEVTSGVGGGPCPGEGLPPFRPGLIAGTLNNRAGSYSPFSARLFRTDGEQEFTDFSLKLPPGVIGKIAGIGYCSDAAIAVAKAREGRPGGGAEELAAPSCPASSEVGRTLVGAGVGSVQAYAPGKLYYAGPYHGSAISLVSITAAKVGPFDLGTVVVRFAIRVNPETAEIFIDPTGSDPIPHLIHGVTVHLRDIRGYVDRNEFVLNPTSCERTSVASTLLGSGLDFSSAVDDLPVTVSTPFQAADCAALAFKPKLSLSLEGATRRAGDPALKAVLTKTPGEANLSRAQVTLPKSEFLDNAHIGTVCTRVQFNAGPRPGDSCPAKSVYGAARVLSPIIDYPLEGPLFLRSNPERELPDLVAALHAPQFDIVAVGHVDSVKGGGIRTTFEGIPDAPLTKVVLTMAGAKKGLLENSTNLCAGKHRATVRMDGQNGKIRDFKPLVKPSCRGAKKGKGHKRGMH